MKRIVINASYSIDTTDVTDINDVWSVRFRKLTNKGTTVFDITMRDNKKPLAKLGIYSTAKLKYPYKDTSKPNSLLEARICMPGERLDMSGEVIWSGEAQEYTEDVENEVINKVISYMNSIFNYVED